jgi:hypothetical protein
VVIQLASCMLSHALRALVDGPTHCCAVSGSSRGFGWLQPRAMKVPRSPKRESRFASVARSVRHGNDNSTWAVGETACTKREASPPMSPPALVQRGLLARLPGRRSPSSNSPGRPNREAAEGDHPRCLPSTRRHRVVPAPSQHLTRRGAMDKHEIRQDLRGQKMRPSPV